MVEYLLKAGCSARTLCHGARYNDIAYTIVQLTRWRTSDVIAASQPIRWDERHCKETLRRKDGKDMPEATWKPHEKHGRLTKQSDLPDSVYAFPKQRKEPLTDAQHVRNSVARFDQVIDVSDADRALAFANIEKAANYYDVNLAETSWHDLGVHPQKNRKEAAAKRAVTRKQRTRKENRK
jgi:hypothetical protein